MPSNRPDLKLRQKDYAAKYGKSLPCIKRWYKRGLSLDDEEAMKTFLRKEEDRIIKSGPPVYDRESTFQDAVSVFLRENWILNVREFQLPSSLHRGDFLLQDYAVECKVTADSAYQAIGQLFIYKRVTKRIPVLLLPDNVRLNQHFVEAVEAIPGLCLSESQFREMFLAKVPPPLKQLYRGKSDSTGDDAQNFFEF